MWSHKPNAKEIATWFKKQKLHEGMEHKDYVNGILAIEDRGTWFPFVKSETRVRYFWDWVELNGHRADIATDGPIGRNMVVSPDGEKQIPVFYFETTVKIVEINGEHMIPVRTATARKQVADFRKTYNGLKPDMHGLMKAETGSVSRALGMMGMLTFPGVGIASAEDMIELMREESSDAPVAQKPAPKKQTRKAANPKANA